MGMECDLVYGFNFIYNAPLTNELIEHELDHVFFGISDLLPKINKDEVESFKYMTMEELSTDIKNNPAEYTEWLKICFNKVLDSYPNIFNNELNN
jgi:isopentenyl-diphosphate delta-isomerase